MHRAQLNRLPARTFAVSGRQPVKRRVELALEIGRDQQLHNFGADGLLAGPAERCLSGSVPVDDPAHGVEQDERTYGVVQQRPTALGRESPNGQSPRSHPSVFIDRVAQPL